MTTSTEHWNTIFSNTDDSKLGWYERDLSQTLKFLDLIESNSSTTVFLPGAGTSLLVDELLIRGHELILNDISNKALDKLKSRIGLNERYTWLLHDISKPLPADLPQADVWIDRAVLHFILDEADIDGYFGNLRSAVRPGGHALMAEFSTLAVPKCAGLEIHRYSVEEMNERMGTDFELVTYENYTYVNPSGDPRPYIYMLYKNSR